MKHSYFFKAADLSGAIHSGQRTGGNKEDVIQELRDEGLFLLTITESKNKKPVNKKVKKTEIMVFTRQLAGLLSSGLQIDQAMGLVAELLSKTYLAQVALDLKKMVQEGTSFSQALEHYEGLFGKIYINLVKAGEKSGLLSQILQQLASTLEEEIELQRELINSLIYPALVTLVSGIATFVMLRVVVPSFADLFIRSGQELPTLTRLILGFSKNIPYLGLFLILAIIGFTFWFVLGLQSKAGRMAWDRFQLSLPLIGPLRLRLNMASFARMLSLMLQSGVQLLEGISILKGTMTNMVLTDLLDQAEMEVRKGGSLTHCFAQHQDVPVLVKQMVGIGEETGNLDEMLAHLAHFYEMETRSEIKNLLSLLGPILILFLTGLVFLIAVAVLLPIINAPFFD
ncbi:MAG TPA: hypothetical protein DEB05_11440 [Firmicutes bacterium]|jgi:general secretion pathway protein F|nr:hypothetical protein [Bacillota bacterium]